MKKKKNILNRSFNCLCHYNDTDLFDPVQVEVVSDKYAIDVGCGDRYTIILACTSSEKHKSKEIVKLQK